MAAGNVDGNILERCLGDSNMDNSCPEKPDTPMGDEQPVIDASAQFVEACSINGQNGKGGTTVRIGQKGNGSKYATDSGQNNDSGVGQHGSGSNKDNIEASAFIPRSNEHTARVPAPTPKNKQPYASFCSEQ